MGVADLLHLGDPKLHREVRKLVEQDVEEGGFGASAGETAGDVGQIVAASLLTGGAAAAARVPRLATAFFPRAQQVVNALRVPGTAGAAEFGFLRAQPKEGEERATVAERVANAATDAAINYGFGGAGKIAGRGIEELVARGVSKNWLRANAAKLMGEGIRITPGMSSKWPFLGVAGTILKFTPGLAGAAKAAESDFARSVREVGLKKAVPRGETLTKLEPHEAIQEIEDMYARRYGAAWKQANATAYRPVAASIRTFAKNARREDRDGLYKLARDIETAGKGNKPELIDKYLDDEIGSAVKKRDVYDFLTGQRADFRGSQPAHVRDELSELDADYGKYKTQELAIGKGPPSGEYETKHLTQALRSKRLKQYARGKAPYQTLATEVEPFTPPELNKILDPIRTKILKLSGEWSPELYSGFRKYMFGEHPWQQKLARMANKLRYQPPSVAGAVGVSAGE
jgi:hypothetical protein